MVMVMMIVEHNTFLFALALSIVTETFGEWIVINFQLSDLREKNRFSVEVRLSFRSTYFLVLISSDRDEFRFFEYECAKRTPAEIDDRIRASNVKTWLIFMHRIQDRLNEQFNHGANEREFLPENNLRSHVYPRYCSSISIYGMKRSSTSIVRRWQVSPDECTSV